jgi:hypothetical protein
MDSNHESELTVRSSASRLGWHINVALAGLRLSSTMGGAPRYKPATARHFKVYAGVADVQGRTERVCKLKPTIFELQAV